MIKDIVIYLLIIGAMAGLHFGVSDQSDLFLFNDKVILGYVVLAILSLIGSSVFLLEKRLKDLQFPQAFMIVTVVQMLGAMSFAAYLRYTLEDNIRVIVLQFVVLFLIYLTFQSVYLIRTKAQR